jgi:hypothetical protein
LLIGCEATRPVRPEIVEIERRVTVPVPERYTRPADLPTLPPDRATGADVISAYGECLLRLAKSNEDKAAIRELAGKPEPADPAN